MRYFVKTILFLSISFTVCQSALAQNIGGIGAQLFLDTAGGFTMPRIMSLIPNSPAYDSLKATDYIMKVNDISCKNKSIEDVVALIRGEAGTTVKIMVADTKEGKRERVYNLTRVGIQGAAAPPPADPLTAFYAGCENEVKQMKKNGMKIIKTFNSDCGDYFFNFNAEAGSYHIRLMTMEEKPKGAYTPGFYPTARVFNNDNEAAAVALDKTAPKDAGSYMIAQLEGAISFQKISVGVISVQIHDDVKKCRGMYVIVYK